MKQMKQNQDPGIRMALELLKAIPELGYYGNIV